MVAWVCEMPEAENNYFNSIIFFISTKSPA